jgi:hypothetical protein
VNGAHSYLRKVAACVQVGAQRGLVPRSVTFPRKPRSNVDMTYQLAQDFGACMLLCYRLARNDEPELWPVCEGLQPELSRTLECYRDALIAERQEERRDHALARLESRIAGHAVVTPAVTGR